MKLRLLLAGLVVTTAALGAAVVTSAQGGLPTGSDKPLDCLACHEIKLSGHNSLVTGNEACWSCHSNTSMTTLHLADGKTTIPLTAYPRLCGQCHQPRYQQWLDGTHGIPAWKDGDTATRSTEKLPCLSCHDPHQPQIVLTNIIKPHASPVPDSPEMPTELIAMVGITLAIVVWFGVSAMKGGDGQ